MQRYALANIIEESLAMIGMCRRLSKCIVFSHTLCFDCAWPSVQVCELPRPRGEDEERKS